MYLINFSAAKRRFCLSLHYNEANSYLFVNGVEIIKCKAKDSENIPNRIIWNCADYGATSVNYILSIHKYLIKKHNIV